MPKNMYSGNIGWKPVWMWQNPTIYIVDSTNPHSLYHGKGYKVHIPSPKIHGLPKFFYNETGSLTVEKREIGQESRKGGYFYVKNNA